ncbi:hypothetical protein QBC35DRAFT_98763 [Podospora australis]|uniref:Xylanolytic transcriptional activator regulatory domain-containing protein n=1 Tax=Podospora australis TaxID=1536484 RepID=A0AAN6X5A4_9PEZI|nr:hypothetical protein QBC35DRAFT_98763 [Podospora australis]
MGNVYFEGGLKKLYAAHTDVSSTATHCLFFVANEHSLTQPSILIQCKLTCLRYRMYFAFLRRPLQAWEYVSSASSKCLILLSYPSTSPEDDSQSQCLERIRRIFWACYVLESDYLAELSSLPLSGIARIEASVPLPSDTYHTHNSPREEELSSLYFLAFISMRRLLNRVHQLLYARGTGAGMDNARFPFVVAELDHQLEEWRSVLPSAFAFDVGFHGKKAETEHGGFLRQRYLTCRSVI